MITVIKGSGESDTEGFGKFNVEAHCAYYILPDLKFTMINSGSEDLIIYLANCDI